ncbi:hypothetical protein F4777DRAFT_564669 [Nemania sp. FL0916]|nr:hypothetical protein F4777DRAFT_564669 [Nemania sp. FL0916]
MPSGPDIDSQFRFLISCIRNSTAGRVDFEEVRQECNIISKGAAAKRYERLMKAHNIAPGGGSAATNGIKKEPKDSDDANKPKATAAKKRKLAEVNPDEGDIDEPVKSDPDIKPDPDVKPEIKKESKGEVIHEHAIVKLEHGYDELPTATPQHRPSSHPALASTNTLSDDDDVLFISSIKKRAPTETPNAPPLPNNREIQLTDDAANTNLAQQLAAAVPVLLPKPNPPLNLSLTKPAGPTLAMSSSFPYGFAPTDWVFPHDNQSYL